MFIVVHTSSLIRIINATIHNYRFLMSIGEEQRVFYKSYKERDLELDFGEGVVEVFALDGGNLLLESRGLARTITSGESSGSPGGS